jgi:hypothetical protein
MATAKKTKKGHQVGRVSVYEMTIAAAGRNGHGVILKSKDMAAQNKFLELGSTAGGLESLEDGDPTMAAAIDAATPVTTKAHGDADDAEPIQGEPITADLDADDEPEVPTAPQQVTPAAVTDPSTEPEVATLAVVPDPTPAPAGSTETIVEPASEGGESEISGEKIGAEILSFAMGLAGAAEDTSNATAIAKAVGSLEFLAQPSVIARLKAQDLPLVIRKSSAAALGQAILQMQGVKGSEDVTVLCDDATRIFKSLHVPEARKDQPTTPASRLKILRKSLAALDGLGDIGVAPTQPAAPAASQRSVPQSSSRTEQPPAAPPEDEGGYLDDIND